ncbi:hypothetical protein BaRGS_00008181 [Batillaria attramentaria]|uniref:G-protein coupled receptors family 1 profile domain-containing protein n=1 Tax=Batillaria attramentaria TaxID=370345 RepID=A0ABD0LM20_9CAEN
MEITMMPGTPNTSTENLSVSLTSTHVTLKEYTREDKLTTFLGSDVTTQGSSMWSDEGDLVSVESRKAVQVIFGCGVQIFLILMGIPGNILNITVFVKQGLRDRVNALLFSLAVTDLISLLTIFLIRLRCVIRLQDPVLASNWEVITTPQILYINRWATFVSGFLIVVMSVDRCVSVTFPLKASSFLTYRRMTAVIVAVYVLVFLLFLPSLLLYTVRWRIDPATNRSIAVLSIAENVPLDKSIPVQISRILSLFVKPSSAALAAICTVITVFKLKQAMKTRHQMTDVQSGANSSETRITKMLVLLSVIYVVLDSMECSSAIINAFVPEFYMYSTYHNTFVVLFVLIFTANCLNATVNFFVYVVLSSRFRATLADCAPCFKRMQQEYTREDKLTTFLGSDVTTQASSIWSDEGDLVSVESRKAVQVIFGCGVQIFLILIGIPGNILNITVFVKQGLRDRVNALLFSLAVTDLISLMTIFLIRLRCVIRLQDPVLASNWEVITTPQILYINRWATFVSGFLIVVMSVDRCVSVTFPLKASSFLTYRRMTAVIVAVYVLVFFMVLPTLLLYTVRWRIDPATNRSIAVLAIAENFPLDKSIPLQISRILNLFVKPSSAALAAICTVITVFKLKQAMKTRHQIDRCPVRG